MEIHTETGPYKILDNCLFENQLLALFPNNSVKLKGNEIQWELIRELHQCVHTAMTGKLLSTMAVY